MKARRNTAIDQLFLPIRSFGQADWRGGVRGQHASTGTLSIDNIGFATLTMNKDAGDEEKTVWITRRTIFFGYCIFEDPSNLLLHKIGARIWSRASSLPWGIVATLMARCASVAATATHQAVCNSRTSREAPCHE